MRRLAGRALAAVAVPLVGGCVVVPATRDVYDADCRMMRREVTLETAVLGQFYGCSGQECSVLLVTMGVISAASLVVSGSMAIVGNVVYWLEHESNCRRYGPVSPKPAAPPAPSSTTPTVPMTPTMPS
jgi:hypothetical protein